MKKGYEIKAQGGKAEILVYGIIGKGFFDEDGISAKEFVEELNELKDVSEILIRLNSPGGLVDAGKAMYNSLVKHPATITVEIEGAAYSIASLLAMAGDTISIAENAMIMIHDPMACVCGDAGDLRKTAEMMDKAKLTLISSYQRHVKLSEKEISDAMSAETWYTAEEAVKAGFATEITEEIKMAALFDVNKLKYQNVPEGLKVAPKLSAEALKKFQDEWEARHTGPIDGDPPIVLNDEKEKAEAKAEIEAAARKRDLELAEIE